MLGFIKKGADQSGALDRVREWTRARFELAGDATIMVSEVACTLPGCAPIETVIAFWTDAGRHHLKVFKPVADVLPDDLPPSWMKNALVEIVGVGCECC
jgi:nitrate reductase delta subunit